MKNAYLIIFLILSSTAIAQKFTPEEYIKANASSENTGRKFIVAFPENEIETHGTQALDIYIASEKATQIHFYNHLIGLSMIRNVYPGEILTISTTSGELGWSFEQRESGVVSTKAFSIESEHPVNVYVLNSKYFSTEGYFALPVSHWGKEYFHCSYYDFDEIREWAGGFTILASEDNTEIEIVLNGIGHGIETASGFEIGDTINIKLKEGETYMVKGTGTTRGQFDLSGTHIKANKPIGVISSHQRTMIPATVVRNGRDHLSEMLIPVRAWGKEYNTLEIDRGTNKGDFFRVMASEPDTYFEARWYDKITGEPIGLWDGMLSKPGDFAEYHPNAASSCPGEGGNNFESIRGFSQFTSQKPIQVMQYSYSACWDNAGGNFDPFMIALQPTSSYSKSLIFQTPSNKSGNDFLSNFLNLIIKGDPNDEQRNLELLSSVKYDGTPIIDLVPNFINNQFSDSLYHVTLFPEIGPHTLYGDAEFSGFTYGFAQFDSYGWSTGLGRNMNGILRQDTLSPILERSNAELGIYQIEAFEVRNADAPDNCVECEPQVDSRFPEMPIIIESTNMSINYLNPTFHVGTEFMRFNFKVDDISKDAYVEYFVYDEAGNFTLDTISFEGLNKNRLNSYVDKEFQGGDNKGRLHILSFPDLKVDVSESQSIDVFISSTEYTKISYYNPDNSISGEIEIEEGTSEILNTGEELDNSLFQEELGLEEMKTLIIESEKPVSVYVIASSGMRTEGYWAIPTKKWGKEYYHNSYYSHNSDGVNYSGGFSVIAAENETEIEIILNGIGDENAGTSSGQKIGDTLNLKLASGECINIKGETSSTYLDLSGTKIRANKKIGVISYHQGTTIPAGNEGIEDILLEMVVPVDTWGLEHHTRKYNITNGGELYRVMASKDDTKYRMRWFSLADSSFKGSWEGILEKAGDFTDSHNPLVKGENSLFESFFSSNSGLLVIETNKPSAIYKYAVSNDHDSPIMVGLTPVSQYVNEVVLPNNIQSDDYQLFNLDHKNLGDGAEHTININTTKFPLIEKSPYQLGRTKYFYSLADGFADISADLPFGGERFSIIGSISFGWNAGSNLFSNSNQDTLKPLIDINTEIGGRYEVLFTETRNQEKDDNCEECLPQVDSKFFRNPEIITNKNFDFYLDLDKNDQKWYLNMNGTSELSYIAKVRNSNFNAELIYQIIDDRGNTTLDTLDYLGTQSVDNTTYIDGNMVKAYPNPVTNILKLQSDYNIVVESLSIFDSFGKRIIENKNASLNQSIDVSFLPSGVYFIGIKVNDGYYKLKFVKS